MTYSASPQTDQNLCTTLSECVACGSKNLLKFLDLGKQPLANSYRHKGQPDFEYELGLNVCLDCWHTQLPVSVDPSEMFDHYLYVTGTSKTLKDYCDWFAKYTSEQVWEWGGSCASVLDIACNDGTQLDSFRKLGCYTTGVDPAKNLFKISNDNKGHTIFPDYWPDSNAIQWDYDVVVAQNVLAHTPDPLNFLKGVKKCLKKTGCVFIQTSQCEMYEHNEFDTVYHEHISFFSTNSMKTLAERAGLVLVDVQKTDIHGTSYLFTLRHEGEPRPSVEKLIKKEDVIGRYGRLFYKQFAKNTEKILDDLKELVENADCKVVGYGAAAKGMTVLNARNIQLDWIVDDNEMKQGLYCPGIETEIKSRESLEIDEPLIIIPLAWNFFDEIKSNVEKIRGDKPTEYVLYFPELRRF